MFKMKSRFVYTLKRIESRNLQVLQVMLSFESGQWIPFIEKKFFILVSFFIFIKSLENEFKWLLKTYPLHKATLAWQFDWIPENKLTFFLIPFGSILHRKKNKNTWRIYWNSYKTSTKTTYKNKCKINTWRINKHNTTSFFKSIIVNS